MKRPKLLISSVSPPTPTVTPSPSSSSSESSPSPSAKLSFREALLRQHGLKKTRPFPQVGVGVSLGCFAGAGYGLAVGIGTVISGTSSSNNTAIILPSTKSQAFAHDGAMIGAFCGIVIGGGFATGIGAHLGYRWLLFDDWANALKSKFIHFIQSSHGRYHNKT